MSRETYADDPVPDVFQTAPPAIVQPMRPVSGSERLLIMDVLRGFAIFGIFMVNIVFFSEPLSAMLDQTRMASVGRTSQIMHAMTRSLFEFKFVSIFSLLFGAGLMMQAMRAEARGASFNALYLRRLLVLAGIGLIHGLLIWYGDILFIYACTAMIVMWFHWARPAVLLPVGAVFVLAGALEVGLFGSLQVVYDQSVGSVEQSTAEMTASTQPDPAASSQPIAEATTTSAPAEGEEPDKESLVGFDRFWAEIEGGFQSNGPPDLDEAEVMAYRDGPMTATLVMRGLSFISMLVFAGLFGGFGFRVVGMFLIGMALMKLGFFSPAKRAWHGWCCAIGLLIGLPAEVWVMWAHHVDGYNMGWTYIGLETLHQITSFFLCFGYIGLVALVVDFGVLRHLTAGLAAVGRMALTNYLLQSVIATTIMYWWGLGWFNSVSRIGQAAIVVGVFALQVPLSLLWLKVFNMGPIEWLWRSMTYWKLQPILRRAQPDMTA